MMLAASRAHARDLCQSPSSMPVAISSATTTKFITGASGQQTRICGFLLSFTGTSFQFVQGTTVSTPCDTGASNLSGAFTPAAAISYGGAGMSVMIAKVGLDVCVVTTGTCRACKAWSVPSKRVSVANPAKARFARIVRQEARVRRPLSTSLNNRLNGQFRRSSGLTARYVRPR